MLMGLPAPSPHIELCRQAEARAATPADAPEAQRARALAALLAACPQTASTTAAADLYSSNLDTHQRLLLLECFAEAAGQLADPASVPRLVIGANGTPRRVRTPVRCSTQFGLFWCHAPIT